jgi:hypothetical protein
MDSVDGLLGLFAIVAFICALYYNRKANQANNAIKAMAGAYKADNEMLMATLHRNLAILTTFVSQNAEPGTIPDPKTAEPLQKDKPIIYG